MHFQSRANPSSLLRAIGMILLVFGLAACQSSPQPPNPVASASANPGGIAPVDTEDGITFAFEPFTGAPGNIADELSSAIGTQAGTQGIRIVRRVGAAATYRVNGYLAAAGQASNGNVFYVFDVVDNSGRRVKRISGSESTGGGTGDPWQAVNSTILTRIAQKSVVELKAWINQS